MIYTDLQTERMLTVLDQVSAQTNSTQQTIEKDWWVTQVLRVLFSLPYAEHLSFKGGTSLSKAWSIIERFSEDILQAPHPSPLSAYRGFFGCKHFSQTNEFLKQHGIEPIDWQIEDIE